METKKADAGHSKHLNSAQQKLSAAGHVLLLFYLPYLDAREHGRMGESGLVIISHTQLLLSIGTTVMMATVMVRESVILEDEKVQIVSHCYFL